jgi:hypothetical protein
MTAFRGGKSAADANGAADKTQFSLNAWFDDPAVLRELESSRGDLITLFSRMFDVCTGRIRAVASIFYAQHAPGQRTTQPNTTTEEAEPHNIETSLDTLHPGLDGSEEEEASAAPSLDGQGPQQERQLRAPPAAQQIYKSEAPDPENPDPFSLDDQDDDGNDLLEDGFDNDDNDFLVEPVALEAIKPLRGEDAWMVRVYEARQIRWERVVAAASVLTVRFIFFTVY